MKLSTAIIVIAAASFVTSPCNASNSEEYAQMGKAAYVAFQCSVLAEKAQIPYEQKRLFEYGHTAGLRFLQALENRQIDEEDYRKWVPVAFTFSIGGPSHEFILGRVFEVSTKEQLDAIYNECNDCLRSDELMKLVSENEYSEQNCKLIGR